MGRMEPKFSVGDEVRLSHNQGSPAWYRELGDFTFMIQSLSDSYTHNCYACVFPEDVANRANKVFGWVFRDGCVIDIAEGYLELVEDTPCLDAAVFAEMY